MNIIEILTAVGISSVLPIVIAAFTNRKINNATAGNSIADYAEKVIKQTDDRVEQYKSDADAYRVDMERLRKERDEWQAECKGQRKAKQEKRALYEEALVKIHELELENSDFKGKLKEADWHRCEVNGCQKRVPPRTRSSNENK